MASQKEERHAEHNGGMKRTLLIGMLLGALVGSWVIWLPMVARAVVCTPLGQFTSALSLCKPLQGEVNWATAINTNWDVLDALYTSPGVIKNSALPAPYNATGIIFMIDSGTCPTGSAELTAMRGRYPRGMLAAGETISTTVGTALTASESRPSGAHTHNVQSTGGGGSSGGGASFVSCSSNCEFDVPTDSGGLTVGTNAPYEIVMFCKKT